MCSSFMGKTLELWKAPICCSYNINRSEYINMGIGKDHYAVGYVWKFEEAIMNLWVSEYQHLVRNMISDWALNSRSQTDIRDSQIL